MVVHGGFINPRTERGLSVSECSVLVLLAAGWVGCFSLLFTHIIINCFVFRNRFPQNFRLPPSGDIHVGCRDSPSDMAL